MEQTPKPIKSQPLANLEYRTSPKETLLGRICRVAWTQLFRLRLWFAFWVCPVGWQPAKVRSVADIYDRALHLYRYSHRSGHLTNRYKAGKEVASAAREILETAAGAFNP